MNFYLFTSDFSLMDELESAGFTGVLHTYNSYQNNPFIRIAKNVDSKSKLKHMVAIRPYTVSPQYLCTINDSFDEFYREKNPIQINFITGWIKENEQNSGGILGIVNDSSDYKTRTKYLIDYIEMLGSLDRKIPDYYVSVTNSFTLDVANKYNSKIIIDQIHFKQNRFDISDKKVMVVVQAINRDGSLKSHEEIRDFIFELQSAGVAEVIFPSGDPDLEKHIIGFVRSFKINKT